MENPNNTVSIRDIKFFKKTNKKENFPQRKFQVQITSSIHFRKK